LAPKHKKEAISAITGRIPKRIAPRPFHLSRSDSLTIHFSPDSRLSP
jgi:hypothetical protein